MPILHFKDERIPGVKLLIVSIQSRVVSLCSESKAGVSETSPGSPQL